MFEVMLHYFFIYNAEPHEFRSARMATNSLQRQITADRGMSLATREQKAVMADFAGDGRFLQLFHAMKKLREKDLKKI